MLHYNISKPSIKSVHLLKWLLKKENIFKTIYLNFVFREALENYAMHNIKGTLNIGMLVEDDILPCICVRTHIRWEK